MGHLGMNHLLELIFEAFKSLCELHESKACLHSFAEIVCKVNCFRRAAPAMTGSCPLGV